MKNKKSLIALIVAALIVTITGTLAYFTDTVSIDNLFTAGDFNVELIETFTSPSNWKPGDETSKVVTAKNNGNVPARVRIKFEEKWEDNNGNILPLVQNGNKIALIHMADSVNWQKSGEYYYYMSDLATNDVTSAIIDKVTFNPAFTSSKECTTSNGTTTCTTVGGEYEDATYTLKVIAEFAQADSYEEAWGVTASEINNPTTYVVIFDSNGGTLNELSRTVTNGSTYGVLPSTSKTGYTFGGWFTTNAYTTEITSSSTVDLVDDQVLHAKWTANTYTIAFNGNGNTGGSTASKTCTYDEDCILTANNFTKSGNVFAGWATESTGSKVYNDKQTVRNLVASGTYTLYAVWDDGTLCLDNATITVASGAKCKRATKLHKDAYNIIYGQCGTKGGDLVSGDALDCDVNGDGKYTERFYYVSDYYNTTTKEFEEAAATLIYYSNVDEGGVASTSKTVKYDADDHNFEGPGAEVLAVLPTTTDWSNITLRNTTRQILTETGTTSSGVYGEALPVFSYAGYAARLLTTQELESACEISSYIEGDLIDTCRYLTEGNNYWWLETPLAANSHAVWGASRLVSYYDTSSIFIGARPAIEILKSEISK